MGLILQRQRRAIESLRGKIKRDLGGAQVDQELCLENGQRVHLLGVSGGFGTCSDIHGLDVMVVGFSPPPNGKPYIDPWVSIDRCRYTVLVREPTTLEESGLPHRGPVLAVELLEPVTKDDQKIVFTRTGQSECYPVI